MKISIEHLRRHAVARSLFRPTTLGRALRRLGVVQADPIRAPARAQDLTLRHRVVEYRAGDLERRYQRLRVARREGGTRVYAPRPVQPEQAPDEASIAARMDALVDVIIAKYAPLPARSLGAHLSLLTGGVPQWRTRRTAALQRAVARLPQARVDGEPWYWPDGKNPASRRWRPDERVRLLTPFDPVVHDRQRFERLWGWRYRFEAYTPPSRRQLGYYALPLLWGDRVIGWGNLSVEGRELRSTFGYVDGRAPAEARFQEELGAELARMRVFLGLVG